MALTDVLSRATIFNKMEARTVMGGREGDMDRMIARQKGLEGDIRIVDRKVEKLLEETEELRLIIANNLVNNS